MSENKNKPKIVMITPDEHLDRRIGLQAKSLREEGWDVVIVSRAQIENSEIDLKKSFAIKIFNLYRYFQTYFLLNNSFFRWLKTFIWLFYSSPDKFYQNIFYSFAVKYKADIYVAHDLPVLGVAYRCAKFHGAKLIYDSHELYVEQGFNFLERALWKKIEKQYIKYCDSVITINESIATELKRRYQRDHVHVIRNAEEIPVTLENNRIFHHTYNLSADKIIILYQGNLLRNRNLDALIKAMSFIHESHIHLVFMGNGAYKEDLLKLTKKLKLISRVHFHDAVPQEKLLSYTVSADIGLIPYQPICLNNLYCTPNKLYEYIVAGLPIIATDLPEISKIVSNYGIGLVGNTNSPKDLATLINHLLQDKNRYLEYKNAVIDAKNVINWNKESCFLKTIYKEVLEVNQLC